MCFARYDRKTKITNYKSQNPKKTIKKQIAETHVEYWVLGFAFWNLIFSIRSFLTYRLF